MNMNENEIKELKVTAATMTIAEIESAIEIAKKGANFANEESAEHDRIDFLLQNIFPEQYENIVNRLPEYYEFFDMDEEEKSKYESYEDDEGYADYCDKCYNSCGRFFNDLVKILEKVKSEKEAA